MSLPIIRLESVSLWRRTQEEFSHDLKRSVLQFLEMKYRPPAKRQVLHDVDLVVNRGEKLGIIGPNGSGKSTMLKVICGILRPTTGRASVEGSIAPLIELGAGFDPDQNLVENIVYYGVLLGVAREEMKRRVDRILDFAELHDHAAEPLKALSSGMVARLGFAVATDIHPDILILDEVLSVGDERFRQKCNDRLKRFWDAHCTILVVSHELAFIEESCERVIWLQDGTIAASGSPSEVVAMYRQSVNVQEQPVA